MLSARRIRAAARDQRGYSLIEALVVISVSTVLIAALLALIVVSLHQSTRTFSKIEVTASARTTIEDIMNELHSACLSVGDTPIQSGSDGSDLIFTSQYGNAASPTALQHTIAYSASAGTLSDTTSSGTQKLLSTVAQSGSTPVFQYFSYQEPLTSSGSPYSDAAGDPYEMLLDGTTPVPGTSTIPSAQPLTVPLSTTDAANAVEVVMTLNVKPAGGTLENTNSPDAPETISDSAVLRLSPAANHVGSGAVFGPCE